MKIRILWSSGLRTMLTIPYMLIRINWKSLRQKWRTWVTKTRIPVLKHGKRSIRIIRVWMVLRVFTCGVTPAAVSPSFWRHFLNPSDLEIRSKNSCIIKSLCLTYIKGSIRLIKSWRAKKVTQYRLSGMNLLMIFLCSVSMSFRFLI